MVFRSARPAPKALANAAIAVAGTRLFTEGDEPYAAMLASVRGARDSVRMESYIFAADEIGWHFTQALAERAATGIDVRLKQAGLPVHYVRQRTYQRVYL